MIGVVSVGPRSSLRRLYVECGFVDVDDCTLLRDQVSQRESILAAFSVKLGSIELGIAIPELRGEETDLVLGVEALQLGPAHILLPDTSDDLRSLLNRERGPVLEQLRV